MSSIVVAQVTSFDYSTSLEPDGSVEDVIAFVAARRSIDGRFVRVAKRLGSAEYDHSLFNSFKYII